MPELYSSGSGTNGQTVAIVSLIRYRRVMADFIRTRRPTSRSLAGPVVLGLLVGIFIVVTGAVAFRFQYLLRTSQAVASAATIPTETRPIEAVKPKIDPPIMKPTEPKAGTPIQPKKPQPIKPIGPALPPPPAPDAKVSISAKETVPIGCPADAIKDVRVSPGKGDVPSVFVLRKVSDGFQGVGATDVIERITRSGRSAGRVEFPADKVPVRRTFQVTDTAQRVLVEAPAGKLTVYDFEMKEKLWDGHDVYAGVMDRKGPPVAAFFQTPDAIATVDQRGTVDIWDVATKERTGQGVLPGNGTATGLVIATRAASTTVVVVGRQVFAYERVSTNSAAVSELPAGAEPIAVDADPLGKQLAIVYRMTNQAPRYSLVVMRIGEKGPQMRCVLPDTFGTPVDVGWIGLETIGVTTEDRAAVLVDAERAVPFGYVKEADAVPFVNEFGLYQYTAVDPEDAKKSVLACVEVPFNSYRQLVREAAEAKLPTYFAPRADGLAR